MQKVFKNGSKHDSRRIMIKIDDGFIEFFFYEQYCRQQEWIEAESQRRFEYGEDPLSEDESANSNFYWIGVNHWVEDKTMRLDRQDNWQHHMREKNWFTEEMKDFIDKNTAGKARKISDYRV